MKRTTLPRVLVLIALASIMAHGQVIDADSSGPDMVSGVQAEGNGSVYISLFRSTGDQHAPVAMLEVKGSLWFNSIGIVGSLDGLQSLGFAKDKTQSIAEGVPLQWLKITARSLVQGKALVTTEDGNSYIIFNLGGFCGADRSGDAGDAAAASAGGKLVLDRPGHGPDVDKAGQWQRHKLERHNHLLRKPAHGRLLRLETADD